MIIMVLFDMCRWMSGHDGPVNSVAFSVDGHKILSSSFDKTVKIWNADSGEVIQTLSGEFDIACISILYMLLFL